jgi:hypothetical protein
MISPSDSYNPLTGVFVAPIAPIIGQQNMSFLSNSKAAMSMGVAAAMLFGFSIGGSFSPAAANYKASGTYDTYTGKILEKFVQTHNNNAPLDYTTDSQTVSLYPGQCVSLAKRYMVDIGATVLQFSGGKAGPSDGYPIPSYIDLKASKSSITIENSRYKIEFVDKVEDLRSGDMVVLEVFKKTEGPFNQNILDGYAVSHIGIATGGMKQNGSYDIFNQNFNGQIGTEGAKPKISTVSHQSFYGAVRFIPKN